MGLAAAGELESRLEQDGGHLTVGHGFKLAPKLKQEIPATSKTWSKVDTE